MEDIDKLQELQNSINIWANETFGKGRGAAPVLKHLVREAKDLVETPYDILAYSDVLILLLNAAAEAGYSVEDLVLGIETKHKINLSRDWEETEDGTMSHVIKKTQI